MTDRSAHSILWRRLDQPGHDAARLLRLKSGWELAGSAVFAQDGEPVRLNYRIVCDDRWQTRSAEIGGWMGLMPIALEVAADEGRQWKLNNAPSPLVAGCLDIDLGFTPATNLLPIRRLGLPVSAGADVRSAWLGLPALTLELLDQRYRRTGPTTYHYESEGGHFQRELAVNAAGFVTQYPGLWQAEAYA